MGAQFKYDNVEPSLEDIVSTKIRNKVDLGRIAMFWYGGGIHNF